VTLALRVVAGEYPHNCAGCNASPYWGERWGNCGRETAEVQYRDHKGRGVHRCPIAMADPLAVAVVQAWVEYHAGGMGRGPLPFSGGWLEQPAWVAPAFGVCAQEWARIDKERQK
jgi:hypothetical protein